MVMLTVPVASPWYVPEYVPDGALVVPPEVLVPPEVFPGPSVVDEHATAPKRREVTTKREPKVG